MESSSFPPETERSLVEHMNEFYADANLRYAKAYGQLLQATEARMVALDKAGMELEVTVPEGARRIRISFDHRLQDEGDAQQTLVEMSFNARDILALKGARIGIPRKNYYEPFDPPVVRPEGAAETGGGRGKEQGKDRQASHLAG